VTCEGESLSLSHYPSASSKPQVTGDVSPGPNLPKEKEPPHRGDIGWDRFLLRQFGLHSYSLFPSYKLCDNNELSSELVSVISELSQDDVSVPGLSMRDLQHYGTLLSHEDLIDPPHQLFNSIFLLLVQFFFQ
jgi:hypothetical protein